MKVWVRWTAADDATLRRLDAAGASSAEMAHALGRSENAVRKRRKILGLTTRFSRPEYTQTEDQCIVEMMSQGGGWARYEEIGRRLGRPAAGIKYRVRALRLKESGRQRRCLRCQRMFASNGPGNRICKHCGRLEIHDTILGHPYEGVLA